MTPAHQSDEASEEATRAASSTGSTVDTLQESVQGDIVQPGDDEYSDARAVWNGAIDRYPAAIVRCTGVADVVAAVDVAREEEMQLAVKGGGHHTAGHAVCDDGLMIDLAPMNGVRVDPDAKTVRVQGGATWGDLNHELRAFGLDIVGMNYPEVGVAGFTLGGGIGVLSRTHGLAIDNLRGVDVVTADGELVHASEDEHPDLFWALRGGGGNFGVVTSFEFDCHEVVPEALIGMFLHPVEATRDVLEFYRDFTAAAPNELMGVSGIIRVPEGSALPESLQGEPVAVLAGIHTGSADEGEQLLQPMREFGNPLLELVETRPYDETGLDALEAGRRNHWKNHLLSGLQDTAIETLVEQALPLPDATIQVSLNTLGGAISQVAEGSTAYPHRDATHFLEIVTQWSDPAKDEELTAWAQELHEAMTPHATGGEYVNVHTDADPQRSRAAYGANYDRLVDVKTEWDPGNLFRLNQNIEPST